jgi:hypothetical protein
MINSDEPDDISNDYGDQGWRDKNAIVLSDMNCFQKFIVSYRWAAIRNPHYNLKLTLAPKKGEKENVKIYEIQGTASPYILRDWFIWGKQSISYTVKGYRYFRYSYTRYILWGKIITIRKYLIFGKVLKQGKLAQNVQLGANDWRYLFKHKLRIINKDYILEDRIIM